MALFDCFEESLLTGPALLRYLEEGAEAETQESSSTQREEEEKSVMVKLEGEREEDGEKGQA